MGFSSDSEKRKNGGKVNLTAYLFVSRAPRPAVPVVPAINILAPPLIEIESHSIFYTNVSYSLDQVIKILKNLSEVREVGKAPEGSYN